MLRSVSFVERLELEFSGSHFSHALALGDVDGDELKELVIGNVDGVLAIFKGISSIKPWKKCSGLGTITCVGVGDVLNIGKNVLVAMNAEGVCFIFAFNPDGSQDHIAMTTDNDHTPPKVNNALSMKPSHTQDLHSPNVKVLHIADIGAEGMCDLFVGHTDRVVAVYRWSNVKKAFKRLEKFTLPGQIGSLSTAHPKEAALQLLVSQPGGVYCPISYTSSPSSSPSSSSSSCSLPLGSDSPHPNATNKRAVPPSTAAGLSLLDVVGQPLRRNPTSSAEVVGGIVNKSSIAAAEGVRKNLVALCTLDGCIRMFSDEVKQWELQVDHSLFSIEKLDITGSGDDEIVACAWDGMTYVVDQKHNVVRYQFEENVSAFCAGCYGVSDGNNVPVLIYTTFSNRIFIYHRVTLPAIPPSNLLHTLHSRMQFLPEATQKLLESLDNEEKRTLFHAVLYGSHSIQGLIEAPRYIA